MGNIRLVVTDLDDTLLNPQKEISPAAIQVVSKLKERGIGFTFITGRPPYAVQRFVDVLALDSPIVSCNGAILYTPQAVLTTHSFALAPLQNTMIKAAEMGLTVLYYSGGTEYALSETSWTQTREKSGRALPIYRPTPKEWQAMQAEKVNIMAQHEQDGFARLDKELELLHEDFSIAGYGALGCEIVAKGVNKAEGLKELCQLLAVPVKSVLAIGDNANDTEMLQKAGIGAAVANATPKAKEAADYVCCRSYADGVVEAIEKFVLGE